MDLIVDFKKLCIYLFDDIDKHYYTIDKIFSDNRYYGDYLCARKQSKWNNSGHNVPEYISIIKNISLYLLNDDIIDKENLCMFLDLCNKMDDTTYSTPKIYSLDDYKILKSLQILDKNTYDKMLIKCKHPKFYDQFSKETANYLFFMTIFNENYDKHKYKLMIAYKNNYLNDFNCRICHNNNKMEFCSNCLLNNKLITKFDVTNYYKLNKNDIKNINYIVCPIKSPHINTTDTKLFVLSDIISASINKHGLEKHNKLIDQLDHKKKIIQNKRDSKIDRINDYIKYWKIVYENEKNKPYYYTGLYETNLLIHFTNTQIDDILFSCHYYINHIHKKLVNNINNRKIPTFENLFFKLYYEHTIGPYAFRLKTSKSLYDIMKTNLKDHLILFYEQKYSKNDILPNFLDELMNKAIQQ